MQRYYICTNLFCCRVRIKTFFYSLTVLLAGLFSPVALHSQAWQDSVRAQTRLLTELSQSENLEKAVVEAGKLRVLLIRQKIACPPATAALLSSIYHRTRNETGALRFLEELEAETRRDRNVFTKSQLLSVLVKEYTRWQLPEKALFIQQQLTVVQDSIAARHVKAEQARSKRQLDSLQRMHEATNASAKDMVMMERDRALLLGGILGLIFLALLITNARTNDRWRKKMDTRELEMEIQLSTLRGNNTYIEPPTQTEPERETRTAIDNPVNETTTVVEAVAATVPLLRANPTGMGEPTQLALLIEPNRQIVLYLKSLLSDRFLIETVANGSEGIHKANNMLPDLIICDALLNGKTGIDVARQIKLAERTNHIPVILLTEKFGNEGKLDALRAGADAWFNRPVLDDEFDGQVNRLLAAQKDRHAMFGRVVHFYFTPNRIEADNPFLHEIMRMIEQNISDHDFTADAIARKLQMPNTLFVRKLKALTGKEPVQLIREMRLEKAKILLESRAAMPQVIAELVGYSNPGAFSLAFKEYFGENTLLLQMPNRRLPGNTENL
jgi:CheY-like chemotaxis protein/AraC-like DNA-binding protein